MARHVECPGDAHRPGSTACNFNDRPPGHLRLPVLRQGTVNLCPLALHPGALSDRVPRPFGAVQEEQRNPVVDIREAIRLPARLTADALETLRGDLRDREGEAVEIAVQDWRRPDSRTLQLLMAAQADWRARGLRLTLTGVSRDLADTFRLIGLHPDMLAWEEGV